MTINGNTLGDAILAERARGGRSYSADTKARVRAEAGEIADAVNTEVAAVSLKQPSTTQAGIFPTPAPTDLGDASAGAVLTTAQLLTGILQVNTATNGDAALTTPAGADLVDDLATAKGSAALVGDSVDVRIVNESTTGGDTATVTADAAATIIGNAVVAINDAAIFRFRLTNVGAATEAYDVIRIG